MSAGTLHIDGDYNQTADAAPRNRARVRLQLSTSSRLLARRHWRERSPSRYAAGFLPQAGEAFAFITASGFGGTTFGSTIAAHAGE